MKSIFQTLVRTKIQVIIQYINSSDTEDYNRVFL